jgi:hypothetical protein
VGTASGSVLGRVVNAGMRCRNRRQANRQQFSTTPHNIRQGLTFSISLSYWRRKEGKPGQGRTAASGREVCVSSRRLGTQGRSCTHTHMHTAARAGS